MPDPSSCKRTDPRRLQHAGAKSSGTHEDRRMAIPPGTCRHNHFWGNCSICLDEWDERYGFGSARRWLG